MQNDVHEGARLGTVGRVRRLRRLRHRRWRPVLLVLVASALVLLVVGASQAAPRAFSSRFSDNLKGNFVFVGNTILTCQDAVAACPGARDATGGTLNNNDFVMRLVDVDSDAATFDSSQADLSLAAGSTVEFAGLYWGADTSAGAGGGVAAPDATKVGTVVLTPPGGSPTVVTATPPIDSSGTRYQAFADVTSLVESGGNGTYTLADVQAGTGQDRYGGWSLVVVYSNSAELTRNVTVFDGFQVVDSANPTITIPVSGFLTPPSGTVDTALGVLAYEGDRGFTGDSLQLGPNLGSLTTMTDAQNPAANFFNSTISRLGALLTTKFPNYVNQLGFDADVVDASGVLPNGSNSAVMRLTTGGETYFPGVVVFATQLFAPDLLTTVTKTATDLNGGQVLPGDTLRYAVSLSNIGTDGATNVVLDDAIPAGTSYVPGSLRIVSGANAGTMSDAPGDDQAEFGSGQVVFRLGTGATSSAGGSIAPAGATSISFDVTVDPTTPDGTVVSNAASLAYNAQTLGTAYSGPSPTASVTVVNQADLSITKVASTATYTPGSPLSYTITASNSGPADVTGATVTDTVPAALTGFTWTCASGCSQSSGTGSISTAVDIAASGSVVITLSGTVPGGTVGALSNTASIAPPAGTTDTDGSNNSATSSTPVAPIADLSVTKTASRTTYAVGSPLTYTITVSNGGPSGVVGAAVTDTVPAALSGFTWTCASGCSPSSGTGSISTAVTLTSGASSVITLTGTIPAKTKGTLSNTATVAAPAGIADPNPGNNSATRVLQKSGGSPPPPSPPPTSSGGSSADLEITKGGPGTANVGDTVTFTLTARNNGPAAAKNVIVSDTLPNELLYIVATGPSGVTCSVSGQVVRCTDPSLAAAATMTITIQVKVVGGAGGSVVNIGSISSDTPDPAAGNNSSSAPLAIGSPPPPPSPKPKPKPKPSSGSGSPRLTLTKRWLVSQVRAGEAARALITVRNSGRAAAENVEVCDTGARQLSFVAAPGAFYKHGWACWRVGRLTPDARRTFTVIMRIDRTARGKKVVNVATATASNLRMVEPARAAIRIKPARGRGRPGGVTG
jgi:uncharacterized repeat protein (TIGR01451 family)